MPRLISVLVRQLMKVIIFGGGRLRAEASCEISLRSARDT
jgi:hypothetical protein